MAKHEHWVGALKLTTWLGGGAAEGKRGGARKSSNVSEEKTTCTTRTTTRTTLTPKPLDLTSYRAPDCTTQLVAAVCDVFW